MCRMKLHPITRLDARALDPGISRRLPLAAAAALVVARRGSRRSCRHPSGDGPRRADAPAAGSHGGRRAQQWNTGSSVEDLAREKNLADDVAGLAPRYGLNPRPAATFFRAQIETTKLVESAFIARWTLAHAKAFADVPDQRAVIRPKIDRFEELLAAAQSEALTPQSSRRGWSARVMASAMTSSGKRAASRIQSGVQGEQCK